MELKDNGFERETDKNRSGEKDSTDYCAHMCQVLPEMEIQEFQGGSVGKGQWYVTTCRNGEQDGPRRIRGNKFGSGSEEG